MRGSPRRAGRRAWRRCPEFLVLRYHSRVPSPLPAPIIDAAHAAFLLGRVSIVAASRDARNVPTLMRGLGCRVSRDRRQVTVLLRASQSASLLADLRASGVIAVVFSEPSTHRTLQLKGEDARVGPLQRGDAGLLARYRDAMVAEICPLGYAEALIRAMFSCPVDDAVAVTFRPSQAFSQTPGPGAGQPLKAGEPPRAGT
jgi:hypothetical protein